MTLETETEDLRRELQRLAREAETGLVRRYALQHPPPRPLSVYRRVRMLVGKLLRRFGFLVEPWQPGLRHANDGGTRPFVIWGLDTDRETLRAACRGFQKLQAESPDLVPILITDVADFAFFSRLGWLVEYVPALSSPADGYAERKKRYLAWQYRAAPALPLSAGLREGIQIRELLFG